MLVLFLVKCYYKKWLTHPTTWSSTHWSSLRWLTKKKLFSWCCSLDSRKSWLLISYFDKMICLFNNWRINKFISLLISCVKIFCNKIRKFTNLEQSIFGDKLAGSVRRPFYGKHLLQQSKPTTKQAYTTTEQAYYNKAYKTQFSPSPYSKESKWTSFHSRPGLKKIVRSIKKNEI